MAGRVPPLEGGSVANPAATALASEALASLYLTLPTCQMGQSLLGLAFEKQQDSTGSRSGQ